MILGAIEDTCLDCPDRHLYCHSTCDKDAAAHADFEKRKGIIRKAKEQEQSVIGVFIANGQKRSRRNHLYRAYESPSL
jgi:hypothetical protein